MFAPFLFYLMGFQENKYALSCFEWKKKKQMTFTCVDIMHMLYDHSFSFMNL